MKFRLHIFYFLLIPIWGYTQLIPQQNQYLFNGLSINPAYAGVKEGLSISAGHSTFWQGFKDGPSNQFLSVHTLLGSRKHGAGLQVNRVSQGLITSTEIGLNYAYHLKLSENNFLSFGVSPILQLNGYNWDKLILNDDNDNAFNYLIENENRLNFGAGIYYYGNRFFVGISLPSFLINSQLRSGQEEMIEIAQNQNIFGYFGYIFKRSDDLIIRPSLLIRNYNLSSYQADFNLIFFFKQKLNLGITAKTNLSLLGLIGITLAKKIDFNYAYEYSFNIIQDISSISHHLMLRYELKEEVSVRNPRYF